MSRFSAAAAFDSSRSSHSTATGLMRAASVAPGPRNRELSPGNQRRQNLLRASGIQAKLTVSQPGDRFEREADRAAETVMRMADTATPGETGVDITRSAPQLRRACSDCEEEQNSAPLQRMCAGCREEFNRSGDEEEILARNAPGRIPDIGPNVQHQVDSLRGSGQPLTGPLRAFFEPRFGYDFGGVHVHTGVRAAEAARSVNALAYTMGNDVVFGEGQYRPGAESGGKLLAHELAHVVQQGAANPNMQAQRAVGPLSGGPPALQRQGNPSLAPSGMSCPIANTSSVHPVITDVFFSLGAATLTPTAITDLASFVASWTAAGANRDVRVDGFASTDGPEPTNWTLSCDRALAVAAELENPSGAPGIPNQFIEFLANGETTQFGAALPPNRRATVSADLAAPACANPGVSRTLDLQPIFLRTDPADAAPTGGSWTRRFNESNAIWGKIGVTFVELTPITLNTPLKTTGSTVAEILAIMALRSGPGIEVFLADNDLPATGGGGTRPGCGGAGKIVISDRGASDTLLAHELGHTLLNTVAHPPAAGDPGTVMDPSGSNLVDNPRKNTMVNFAAIACPPGSGSTCLNPDP